jgi:hypothetical protein
MKYSFTASRPKHLVQYDTRIWITFITIMTTMMLGFSYLLNNDYQNSETLIKNNDNAEKLSIANTEQITEDIRLINLKDSIYNDIKINNSIFHDSIKNLLDLVPNQIVLHSLQLSEDKLIIKGYTPTKEIYNYLFDVPLKSIFDSSKTTFYMLGNGKYSFLSINTFEQKEPEPLEGEEN